MVRPFNAYDLYLDKNAANYAALSPLSFLQRVSDASRDRTAIIYGDQRWSWGEVESRCRRFASALKKKGIGPGDTIAMVAPNIPAAVEAHFSVPMTGAVLNMLNSKLDAEAIAFQLEHAGTKIVMADPEFVPLVRSALRRMLIQPLLVYIEDPFVSAPHEDEITYEGLIAEGDETYNVNFPRDEWDAITLTYTSGTTGNPKGVVYHHRGAYLNAIGNALAWSMAPHPVFLWTLPLSHCNGWCFPWTITMLAGTHVCLRTLDAESIYKAIDEHHVGYFCGAPMVMNLLVNAKPGERRPLKQKVHLMTAGSSPAAALIERCGELGFNVLHVYGLTEVYGPATVCAWKEEWSEEAKPVQAQLKARQGVLYPVEEGLVVADPMTLLPVPRDGVTLGEIFIRGNTVMKGYLKNASATRDAFSGGWFHTGDLAVRHPDGYIEIKDRLKDIILSGNGHISTIEIESALYKHPDVREVAVVQRPDDATGESPFAFVTLVEGSSLTEAELVAFSRNHLAEFKIPTSICFGPLPKSAAGKVMKYILRERALELSRQR